MKKEERKILTSRFYSVIFRKILPTLCNGRKIGQTEHALRINAISRKRQANGFDYSDLPMLELMVDNHADEPEFDPSVRENNFINWINGVSSPKHLVMINSILEYLCETCRDDDKRMLLKYETLQLLKCGDFAIYTEHLVDDAIRSWIGRIEADHADALFMAVKEILYLLKNKPRFIQYILAGQQPAADTAADWIAHTIADTATDRITDLSSNPPPMPGSIRTHPFETPSAEIPSSLPMRKKRFLAATAITLCCLFFLILMETLAHPSASSDSQMLSDRFRSHVKGMNRKLVPPEIIFPKDKDQLAYSDLEISWDFVKSVDSYTVAVTDTGTWEQIYLQRGITSDSTVLGINLFHPGGSYRIFVLSSRDEKESEPNFVDVSLSPLASPRITKPTDLALRALSSIELEWDPVPVADSYTVNILETTGWTSIYAHSLILDCHVVLDESIFRKGSRYRIYVHANAGKTESVPSYLDISFSR